MLELICIVAEVADKWEAKNNMYDPSSINSHSKKTNYGTQKRYWKGVEIGLTD